MFDKGPKGRTMTVVFTGRFGTSMFDKSPKVFEKRSSDQSVLGQVYLTRVQKK